MLDTPKIFLSSTQIDLSEARKNIIKYLGVLKSDLFAMEVFGSDETKPVDLSTGYANVIWQGDANSQILRALKHCSTPSMPLNVSNSPPVSIRTLSERLAIHFDKPVKLTGKENETSWLIDTSKAASLFGPSSVPLDTMISWIADWTSGGGESLGKPTHFEIRDGSY